MISTYILYTITTIMLAMTATLFLMNHRYKKNIKKKQNKS